MPWDSEIHKAGASYFLIMARDLFFEAAEVNARKMALRGTSSYSEL